MSGSHDKLPKIFWVQLALAAFIGVMYLITPAAETHETNTSEADASTTETTASKNLEPIGAVAVKSDKPETGGAGRSGEEVYNGVCGTCHNTGIANAPKIDDKAAWEPRLANGLQGLIDTATIGRGAMPPKGGDPAITEEELKATILYMTNKVGIDLSSSKKKEKETATKESEPKKVTEQETQKADKSEVTVTPSAPEAPVAPIAPEVKKEIPAPAEPIAVAVVAQKEVSQPATEKTVDLELGKKIYSSSCFACHDSGVAGSPKIGDKAAWTSRIATGADALYASAIKGKGVMPPKGGNNSIPDGDVKSAVDYILSMSK